MSMIRLTVVVLVLLLLVSVSALSLGQAIAGAGVSDATGRTIVIPLPESEAAVQTDTNGLCRFTGTDIQYVGQTGEPSLPCQSIRVLLPPDADLTAVDAKIAGARWTGIEGTCDVPPVPPVATGNGDDTCAVSSTEEAMVSGRDAGIYGTDTLFPVDPIRKVDVQEMRGWLMAQVFYAPFAYNPVEKKLFRLSGKAIEIIFERTSLKTSAGGIGSSSSDEVREMTVNFSDMSGAYGGFVPSAGTGRYVIVTTSAIQAASNNLEDFIASKEARGFTVQVVTEGTWGGSTGNTAAENLRSWLQANYTGLDIKYVLLIGNPNPSSGDVPMKMCYPQDADLTYSDCPTDFYYADLTSDWNPDGDGRYGEYDDDFSGNPPRAAEIAVGRIPYYGTVADLDHILSKIIDYENDPASAVAWRDNALLPMKPSDADTPGYHLGEEIMNTVLIPNVWTWHRVYDEQYGLNPAPETTPCSVTNVTNAWNGSDFGAVFWWTHGSSTTAAYVMDQSHAATLDDAHPSFAFQSSCSNGTPEASNNLGYSLLKNGCIATVSASRVSWYIPGQTSFSGTPTNAGMTFEYARRLIADKMYAGDALNDLKLDISPYAEELWMNYLDFNLYGCPAVGLSTPPVVATAAATEIGPSSVHLNGSLTSLGTADNVTVSFEWGSDSSYDNTTKPQITTGTGSFGANINGLTERTTYHFRAKAVGDDTAFGDELTFTTLPFTPPTAVVNPAVQNVGKREAFSVDIEVDPSGYGVSAGEVKITFDASAMSVDNIVYGDLFGASPLVGTKQIDNDSGTVRYALARVGTTTPPTSVGVFATITFTAKSTVGVYPIVIASLGLCDENQLDLPAATVTNGSVTISYPEWDINQDGKVDYLDLAILAAHYGETTSLPYPAWDINGDGTVDYKDLGRLGAHYGEAY